MKAILIAYDGSECSKAIIAELHRAGLPSELEALVVSVAEVWTGPAANFAGWAASPETLADLNAAKAETAQGMHDARVLAQQGAASLRAAFPEWCVETSGDVGSASRAILQRAQEIPADIIFIGSHSRSTVGRFFLGSVSQKIATEAKCSVRICRPRVLLGVAPRLLVAVDGSQPAQAAVQAVAERAWPAGTTVAVVNVVDPPLRAAVVELEYAVEIQRQHEARLDWLETVGTNAQRQLEGAGFIVERHVLEGDPKSTLLEWAERWNADCLFIGASGLHHPDAETLGTVASALAVRAHCSVEIARL